MTRDDPYDDLSRLLDGELPADREEALRRQIADDPDLARAWAAMERLPADLAALPAEAPPPELDARVLRGDSPGPLATPRPNRSAVERWLPWAVAAGLVVALLWPGPREERVLAEGSELVDGHALVIAGDVPVEVDGRALITVEPAGGPLRVPGQEDSMMDKKTILAAVAGAAVTVAVYEGTALIHAGSDDAVEVLAGETETVGTRSVAHQRPSLLAPRRIQAGTASGGEATREELLAEVARLQDEVDQLQLQSTMARGQVGHYEGVPQPWPADVAEAYRAGPFERFVQDALADRDDLELLEVDCAEFPCVALIQSHSDAPDWPRQLEAALGDLSEAGFGEEPGMSVWASNSRTDEGEVRLMGFSVMNPGAADEDALTRTNFRAENLLKSATEEALDAPPGEEAVEVR